jgi:hypothetical protein
MVDCRISRRDFCYKALYGSIRSTSSRLRWTLRLLRFSLSQLNTASLPFFGNVQDKQNVMLWLSSIEIKMNYNEVPLNTRVHCGSSYLSDTALIV